jgi:hypothetical protein
MLTGSGSLEAQWPLETRIRGIGSRCQTMGGYSGGWSTQGEQITLLSGMLNDAKGPERSMEEIILRQMNSSLASIHTTIMASTYCLLELCRHPEYIELLLEEARDCIS